MMTIVNDKEPHLKKYRMGTNIILVIFGNFRLFYLAIQFFLLPYNLLNATFLLAKTSEMLLVIL